MDSGLAQDGKIAFELPRNLPPHPACFTYFKVFGNLSQGTPLLCLHGGPGAGHNYLLSFAKLWSRSGVPVIFYDQVGCGKSTLLPGKKGDVGFWNMQLFIAELRNVVDHFNLQESGYHLLGHSFGGMIATAFASMRPPGLLRLIIASGTPSHTLYLQSLDEVKRELPEDLQAAITTAVQINDFKEARYLEACDVFFRQYLCRTESPPPEMEDSLKNMDRDDSVADTLLGPSPWSRTGSMLGWDIGPKLERICVPTLAYNAEYDTSARNITQVPFKNQIPDVRCITFRDAGHSVHLESQRLQERVLELVRHFLSSE